MKRWLLTAVVLVVIAGCAGIPNEAAFKSAVGAWDGHDVGELVKAWGPPNNTFATPGGGTLYTYYEGRIVPTSCTVDFMVDRTKKIIGWRFTGTSCRTVY